MKRANLEEGGESGRNNGKFHTAVPLASRITDALLQLPEAQGSAKQIYDTIASDPLFVPLLDWSVDPNYKNRLRWQSAVLDTLRRMPQVVFAFITIYVHYQQQLWIYAMLYYLSNFWAYP